MNKNNVFKVMPNPIKSDFVFVYSWGYWSGKTHFTKLYFPDHVVYRDITNCDFVELATGKKIFYNCNDLPFLKHMSQFHKGNVRVYILDYDGRALRWLKTFCQVHGLKEKKPPVPIDKSWLKRLFRLLNIPVEYIPFIFDDRVFCEKEMKLSKLIL
ncbi:hypothetical protein EDEG_01939 [Edhazardia aedis USNM 41457]|uniref:Uncharacterized protein n=1 Tax=Edhazardia aedis (strain USNM 41457) TaxID=1003232 RepID=J9D8A5_EDHAE|nr:hypothetical protein EDEG_01939 [Edhazardia aedis USNM 41457]|eukprot:EJW03744.1 hypothetical protein EDEG_01939 [Edhazardia aedis USNM 41457]